MAQFHKTKVVHFSISSCEAVVLIEIREFEPDTELPLRSWHDIWAERRPPSSEETLFYEETEDLVCAAHIPEKIKKSIAKIPNGEEIIALEREVESLSERIGLRYAQDDLLEEVESLATLARRLKALVQKALEPPPKKKSSRRKKKTVSHCSDVDDALTRAFDAYQDDD